MEKRLNRIVSAIIIVSFALVLMLISKLVEGAVVPASAVRTIDVHDICTTKTGTIRDVSEATKKQVYKNAGIAYGDRTLCTVVYEVDHRISLQLGGTNNISNLQLQAYCTKEQLSPNFPSIVIFDARAKDGDETRLHTAICKGNITPTEAQDKIFNWKN